MQRDFDETRLSMGDMQRFLSEESMSGVQRRLGRVASVVGGFGRGN